MRRKIAALVFLAMAATSMPVVAADVLGFKLTETSRQEFLRKTEGDLSRQQIPAKDTYTVNSYLLHPSRSEFPGLKWAAFMFDAEDRLCAVLLELPYTQYLSQVERLQSMPQVKVIGSSFSPDGSADAELADGTDRIALQANAESSSLSMMFMNAGFKKDNDDRIRAHGYKPKYE